MIETKKIKKIKKDKKIKRQVLKDASIQKDQEDDIQIQNIKSESQIIQINESIRMLILEINKSYKIIGIQKILQYIGDFHINGLKSQLLLNQQLNQRSIIIDIGQQIESSLETYQAKVLKLLNQQDKTLIQSFKLKYNKDYAYLIIKKNIHQITIQQSLRSWSYQFENRLNLLQNNTRKEILIVGNKNSGKTTLVNFFLNKSLSNGKQICILDLDIGKSMYLPATISLYYYDKSGKKEQQTYWIGQFSPLNYYKIYLQSVNKLIGIYRSKYFNSPLIINTMGYLSGLGQLILYEVFNLVQPYLTIFLSNQKKQQNLVSIKNKLEQGSYKTKLVLMNKQVSIESQKKYYFYNNYHAQNKHITESKSKLFEAYLNISTFKELCLSNYQQIYFSQIILQARNGKFNLIQFHQKYTNLQLLILCQQEDNLYKFKGLAYGFRSKIYSPITVNPKWKCLKSELVEFDKQFFNLNEKDLIYIEEVLDCELQYILPNYKALGNAGYRNLASKNIYKS